MKRSNPSITYSSLLGFTERFLKILLRYGTSSKKMESNLKLFLAIMKKYNIVPTFPITANLLLRHSEIIKKLAGKNIEFSIHGYEHIDYTKVSHEKFLLHLEKATKIFLKHNIPFSGFRFPYLRYNEKSRNLLGKNFIGWNSSSSILWDIIKEEGYGKRNRLKFQDMINSYEYKLSNSNLSLPKFSDNILEIPVALPDDDLLIDRLGIKDQKILYKIFDSILQQAHSRGELLVFQFHPERFPSYKSALENLLKITHDSELKIWKASLNSIYEWWKEKQNFSINLTKRGSSEYEVHANCSERATVLIKSNDYENPSFYNGYKISDSNTFVIKSSKRPIIGLSKTVTPRLTKFLENEGYVFEINSKDDNYSVFLDGFERFNEQDEIRILQKIDHSNSPLVRFWRWPNGYKSALSITGDIDAFTLADFFMRLIPS